jgi:hypothetical protein
LWRLEKRYLKDWVNFSMIVILAGAWKRRYLRVFGKYGFFDGIFG